MTMSGIRGQGLLPSQYDRTRVQEIAAEFPETVDPRVLPGYRDPGTFGHMFASALGLAKSPAEDKLVLSDNARSQAAAGGLPQAAYERPYTFTIRTWTFDKAVDTLNKRFGELKRIASERGENHATKLVFSKDKSYEVFDAKGKTIGYRIVYRMEGKKDSHLTGQTFNAYVDANGKLTQQGLGDIFGAHAFSTETHLLHQGRENFYETGFAGVSTADLQPAGWRHFLPQTASLNDAAYISVEAKSIEEARALKGFTDALKTAIKNNIRGQANASAGTPGHTRRAASASAELESVRIYHDKNQERLGFEVAVAFAGKSGDVAKRRIIPVALKADGSYGADIDALVKSAFARL